MPHRPVTPAALHAAGIHAADVCPPHQLSVTAVASHAAALHAVVSHGTALLDDGVTGVLRGTVPLPLFMMMPRCCLYAAVVLPMLSRTVLTRHPSSDCLAHCQITAVCPSYYLCFESLHCQPNSLFSLSQQPRTESSGSGDTRANRPFERCD